MNNVPSVQPTQLLFNRTRYTRWLAAIVVPTVAIIAPPHRQPWVGDLLETAGVMCLVICLVGRGWSSIFIAGRKDIELVTTGPYSVVRNPLYVFSFIGVIGIGLISEMMTLLAIAIVTFMAYYSFVVQREELYVARLHGDEYQQYLVSVPRWIPDFSKWQDADLVEVQPKRILKHLVDSSLFFLSFAFFEILEFLRDTDILLPVLILP